MDPIKGTVALTNARACFDGERIAQTRSVATMPRSCLPSGHNLLTFQYSRPKHLSPPVIKRLINTDTDNIYVYTNFFPKALVRVNAPIKRHIRR